MSDDRIACTLEVETGGKRRTLTLDDKIVTFGRSRKNVVVLREDPKISSQHCQVVRQKDAWMLIDCGSKNKTFLNGEAVSVSALKHGDSFKIGETSVTFRTGAPQALDPKEAEKLMSAKPSSNDAAGAAIAAALAAPAPAPAAVVEPPKAAEAPAEAPRPVRTADLRAAKRPSGLHGAVRVERGGSRGLPLASMACFLLAGIVMGLGLLYAFDGRTEADPKGGPVAARVEQRGQPEQSGDGEAVKQPIGPVQDPVEAPKDPAPDGTAAKNPPPADLAAARKDPVPAPDDSSTTKKEPVKPPEDPVAAKDPPPPEPVPAKEPPTDEPVAAKDPMRNPPPAADDPPPAAEDPDVAVKDPAKDPVAPPPTVEEVKRPPTQFMGLKSPAKNLIFVMDVTGSMEDPATVTPSEFSGPPEIKISAELKRQLEKFNRKDVRTKLDAAKYELVHSIAWMHPDIEFTVIFYSFSPTPWQARLVPANDKNKIDAIKRIKTTSAWGGTNIFDALEKSFEIVDGHRKAARKPAPPPAGGTDAAAKKAEYAIFLVTDGKHNTGRFPDPEEFLKEIRKLNKDDRAVIHTIGVGKPGEGVDPPDPVFLARLASENGGESKMLK